MVVDFHCISAAHGTVPGLGDMLPLIFGNTFHLFREKCEHINVLGGGIQNPVRGIVWTTHTCESHFITDAASHTGVIRAPRHL